MSEKEMTSLYGECRLHDPEFQGPIENRKCRDCLFLLIFLAFIGGFLYISLHGFSEGDFDKVYAPLDTQGRMCGKKDDRFVADEFKGTIDIDMTQFKYLFYYDPPAIGKSICVTSCPEDEDDTESVEVAHAPKPLQPYGTTNFGGRCFPTDFDFEGVKDLVGNLSSLYVQNALADIQSPQAVWIIVGCAVIAILLGFLWLFFLRLCTGIIVWTTILGIVVTLGYASFYYWQLSVEQFEEADENDEEAMASAETTRRIFYVLAGVWGIIVLLVLWLWKRIYMAIAIIQESTKAIASAPLLSVFPFLVFLVLILILVYWSVSSVFLFSSARMVYADGRRSWKLRKDCEPNCEVFNYLIYHSFAIFWFSAFISGVSIATIAGVGAKYYFTPLSVDASKELGPSPILKSLWRALRYNAGSIAFGSLLIAILSFVRWVLTFLTKRMKNKTSKSVNRLMKCLICCLKCVERVVKYISKNAYILIAIYNYSYCKAAKDGFMLVMRNILRVATLTVIQKPLMFLGKLFVAIVAAIFATLFFTNVQHDGTDFHSWQFMVGVVFLVAYIVASMFMGVVETTVDTIFMCFLEDVERNDGSSNKPFFASPELQKAILSSEKNKERR